MTRKIRTPPPKATAREIVEDYGEWVESEIAIATIIRASEISEVWEISFWDGLIVAAAEQVGSSELLTEDLNPEQLIAGIKIVNPFSSPDLAN